MSRPFPSDLPANVPAEMIVPIAATILKTVYERRRDRLNLILETFETQRIATMTRLWQTVSASYTNTPEALAVFIQILEAELEDGPWPVGLQYPDGP